MTPDQTKPDITVRGGIINVPASTEPTHPVRHQPNTPRTKKRTTTRTDHRTIAGDSSTPVKDSPPPKPPAVEDPPPAAAAPIPEQTAEPETDPSA